MEETIVDKSKSGLLSKLLKPFKKAAGFFMKKKDAVDGEFAGNYIEWIIHEVRHIKTPMLILWALGTGFQLALFLASPMSWTSLLVFLATIISLLCVGLMSSGSAVNGLVGLISAFLLIYVNIEAKHYASVIDQLVFITLIDIPLLWRWRTWTNNFTKEVRTVTGEGWIGFFGILSIAPAVYALFHEQHMEVVIVASVAAIFAALYYLVKYFSRFKGIGGIKVVLTVVVAWAAIAGLFWYGIPAAVDFVNSLTGWGWTAFAPKNVAWDSLVLAIGGVASYLNFRYYANTYDLWLISNIYVISLWFSALQEGYTQSALPLLASSIFFASSAIYGRWFSPWTESRNK